jgi:hypothetical protein
LRHVHDVAPSAVVERVEEDATEELELDAALGADFRRGLSGKLSAKKLDGFLGATQPLFERVKGRRRVESCRCRISLLSRESGDAPEQSRQRENSNPA